MIELTEKQAAILELLAEGHDFKGASESLNVSYECVKSTVKRLLKHMNAKNSTHAVVIAMRDGLLGGAVQRKSRLDEWTKQEIAVLKTIYVEHGSTEALKHLPGRSLTALYAKAAQIGVSCNKRNVNREDKNSGKTWKAAEVLMLRRMYPSKGPKGCAELLGRSYKSVMHKAALEGIRFGGAVIHQPREIEPEELDPPIIKKVSPAGSWKVDHKPAVRSIFDMGVPA